MNGSGLIVGALAALFAATPAWAACKLGRMAELPVTMYGSQPMLHTKVNGTDAVFIVDSGAFFSMMSPAGAAQLNLRPTPAPFGFHIGGVGGSTTPSLVTVKTFTFADVQIPRVDFLVGGSDFGGGAAVGLLGQNLLRIADVEYDLADGMIRLMRAHDCVHTNLAYWAGDKPYGVIDIRPSDARDPHTRGTVTVNGVRLSVTFDTGAHASIIRTSAARRVGIKVDDPGLVKVGQSIGVGQRPVQAWSVPIATIELGGESIKNTRIIMEDLGEGEEDMLIGADFFLSHRIFVSNELHKLFFTYNGGQVFSLSTQAHEAPLPVAAVAASPQTPAAGSLDADTLARRGAAFAARRDWPHALTDLDQAITLKPDEPSYLLQRALAREGAGDTGAAVHDLDAFLTLKPDDAQARVMRAGLTLQRAYGPGVKSPMKRVEPTDIGKSIEKHEPHKEGTQENQSKAEAAGLARDNGDDVELGDAVRASAAADLDAADKAAAPSSDLRLGMAELYISIDRYGPAVTQFDLWTKSHDDDARMGMALNGRCWARALAGVELDRAVADCNGALRRQPRAPSYLDSRGLAHLRRGEFDRAIADYDAALAVAPDMAWSLYGRGLARLKVGKAAEGKADLAAAAKLAPRLPKRAARLGLAP